MVSHSTDTTNTTDDHNEPVVSPPDTSGDTATTRSEFFISSLSMVAIRISDISIVMQPHSTDKMRDDVPLWEYSIIVNTDKDDIKHKSFWYSVPQQHQITFTGAEEAIMEDATTLLNELKKW